MLTSRRMIDCLFVYQLFGHSFYCLDVPFHSIVFKMSYYKTKAKAGEVEMPDKA